MNFQQGSINGYRAMCVFITVLTHEFSFFRSMTSERNLGTLIKVNHLWEPK
jgi:hypothetical protein